MTNDLKIVPPTHVTGTFPVRWDETDSKPTGRWARTDATLSGDVYPTIRADIPAIGRHTVAQMTAAAPDKTLQPPSGYVYEIQYMGLRASALAAARELDIYYYDGTNNCGYLWRSGAASVASAAIHQIYPHDEITNYLAATQGPAPVPAIITNDYYLSFDSTGLVAAETLDVLAIGRTLSASRGAL